MIVIFLQPIFISLYLEEEDFREIDDNDSKILHMNGRVSNLSSDSQKHEIESKSIPSDEGNQSKEKGPGRIAKIFCFSMIILKHSDNITYNKV